MTLKHWTKPLATGLTPREVLKQFGNVKMMNVEFPTTDGRKLEMSRYTQPDGTLRLLMQRMQKEFGPQPPPKLTGPLSKIEVKIWAD